MAFQSQTSAFSMLSFATLGAAAILGGATGKWEVTDSVLILLSLPLLCWSMIRIWQAGLDSLHLWGLLIAGAVVLIQAVQLIPLPPSVWTLLPGRDSIVQVYQTAGIAKPWYPLSITPAATLHGLIASLPALAVFLSFLTLTPRETERAAAVICALGVACALLGLAQMALGPTNLLKYQMSGPPNALPIGFFANRNHTALFLAVSLLFLGWALVYARTQPFGQWASPRVLYTAAFALCLILLFLTLSRTGIALGMLAVVSTGFLLFRSGARVSAMTIAGISGGIVISMIIIIQFGLLGMVQRLQGGTESADAREHVFTRTLEMAQDYGPLGSGFGSFPVAFAMQERGTEVRPTFMNQAHNDWVQLLFEGGLPGLALALALIAWLWLSYSTRAAAWMESNPARAKLVLVAAIACGFVFLHSYFDYPLKTLAIQCLFAACCAIACLKVSRSQPAAWRS